MQYYLAPIASGQNYCYWEDAIDALEHIIESGKLVPNQRVDLSVLYEFIKRDVNEEHERLLPYLAQWALAAPSLFPQSIPMLRSGVNGYIALRREEIRCLLALIFWNAFPASSISSNTHKLTKNCLLKVFGQPKPGRGEAQITKIHCFLQYFQQNISQISSDYLILRRIAYSVDLPGDNLPMSRAVVVSGPSPHVESYQNCIQIDFADKSFGGGVLGSGSAQEECMLLAYVEPIVGLLFLEELQDNEVVAISGVRQYNQYQGFSDSLRWVNGIVEAVDGRVLIAIDAEDYRKREHQQYHFKSVTREVKKAMLGFAASPAPPDYEVVTGNWGCGVFKGDIQLKFLIQWVAAAFARRNMRYLTWDKRELMGLEGWVQFFSGFTSRSMLQALLGLKPPGKAVFEQVKDMLLRELGKR